MSFYKKIIVGVIILLTHVVLTVFVLSSNLGSGLYPVDADSISITIFQTGAIALLMFIGLLFVTLNVKTNRWIGALLLILRTLAVGLPLIGILDWLDRDHALISLSYAGMLLYFIFLLIQNERTSAEKPLIYRAIFYPLVLAFHAIAFGTNFGNFYHGGTGMEFIALQSVAVLTVYCGLRFIAKVSQKERVLVGLLSIIPMLSMGWVVLTEFTVM
ncbi:hypothetical protein [Variovorax sp. PCZ-1]|uniref:hypothetical protein n=1 Tax=Variovorax sp. PCZ-1 TaxID=2835533 RepID=UPI001BD0B27E|nr:hypothetical protein [Variovorax sp. PCZ-1]MBS7808559.1 hypothetical protein [Variovorax sp. PCZ-1]